MEFTLTRQPSSTPNSQATLSISYPGSNADWIHVGVSLGYGIYYFVPNTNRAIFKRNEAIHAWFNDNEYHQDTHLLEDELVSSIYSPVTSTDRKTILLTISLQTYTNSAMTTQVTTNPFGLRIWEAKARTGSFLDYKIAQRYNQNSRCFFYSSAESNCILHAFMKNQNEVATHSLLDIKVKSLSSTCPSEKCRYCISSYQCAFALPGGFENFYFNLDMRFVRDGWATTQYDPMNPKSSERSVKITNNIGNDYWVRCPPDCKLNFDFDFLNLYFILIINR